jgi:hypothetical protein
MKQTLLAAILCAFLFPAVLRAQGGGSPDTLLVAAVNDNNATVSAKIFGDLNNDGESDCVIITKQTEKELMSVKNQFGREVDRNRRGLLIAFKKGEVYETALAVPDCFSSENEDGGVYFAPELTVSIERNNLKIHYGHGRYGWWQYTFRYRHNDFELIGYDAVEMTGGLTRGKTSINLQTGKKQTKTNTSLDTEIGEEVFKETWQDIELLIGRILLADIEDFDVFLMSDYYTEK